MTSAEVADLVELGTRDSVTDEPLSRGESIGLAFDCQAGLLSAVAATIVLVLLFRRLYKGGWSKWEGLDASVVALFLAEVVQGISHALDMKWVIEGHTYTGAFCTAQALMQQLGETTVALVTLTIAVQTFCTIWMVKDIDRAIALFLILVEVLFVILFVGIGFGIHTHPPNEYYGTPTPYWCWLGKEFTGERYGGEYVWFWLTLAVSCALYIPITLLYFGAIKPNSWFKPRVVRHVRQATEPSEDDTNVTRQVSDTRASASNTLPSTQEQVLTWENRRRWSSILYPTLYFVMVFPLSVVRWITFGDKDPHRRPIATFFVAVVFGLSGVFNALLYTLTRSPLFQSEESDNPKPPKILNNPAMGHGNNILPMSPISSQTREAAP